MLLKSIIGLTVGAGAGYGYHTLMRCSGSMCVNSKVPAVPITIMAIIGLMVALNSRP